MLVSLLFLWQEGVGYAVFRGKQPKHGCHKGPCRWPVFHPWCSIALVIWLKKIKLQKVVGSRDFRYACSEEDNSPLLYLPSLLHKGYLITITWLNYTWNACADSTSGANHVCVCLPPPTKIPQRISFTFSFRPSCREDVGVVSAFEGKSFDLFSG